MFSHKVVPNVTRIKTVVRWFILLPQKFSQSTTASSSKLSEIGRIEPVQPNEAYDRGQIFIHRRLNYRGVVLFPWQTRIHDRDILKVDKKLNVEEEDATAIPPKSLKNDKVQIENYYQVLIDARDEPFIANIFHLDAVTYLSNVGTNPAGLCSLHALDHVAHSDIIPYQSFEQPSINHELYDRFFQHTSDAVVSKLKLMEWQERHKIWLECSAVYKETTDDIRVTVIPFYLGFDHVHKNYWWRYSITIEYLGNEAIHLRERNWRVFSVSGSFESIKGRGVIGKEPSFTQVQPLFQYGSNISLSAPAGHMWGSFRFENLAGDSFDCRIPPFILESKTENISSKTNK